MGLPPAGRIEALVVRSCPSQSGFTAFWLVMVAILAHALIPVGSPIQRTNGSAFSVSTVDVSIAPKRRQLHERKIVPASARDDHGIAVPPAIVAMEPAVSRLATLARPADSLRRPAPDSDRLRPGRTSLGARAPPGR